jgi:hypothetical protein
LWGVALSAMIDLKSPTFSITALTAAIHGGMQGTSDIPMDFDEVSAGTLGNITVNVT